MFDILIQLLCGMFLTGTLIYVFMPSSDVEIGVDKTRLAYLYERKDVIYENLRDLNFEFKAGKFTEADYEGMRRGMEAEAARLLAEIEQLEAAQA
ncbi:MAG TPA: hypothetical protein VKE93_12000 [Candidatus Angelobacter sp.]|nr:hypothetical protein [Candidatus Angelobacter sp.]